MAEDEEPDNGEGDPCQSGLFLSHEVVVAVDGVPGPVSPHNLHAAHVGLVLDEGSVAASLRFHAVVAGGFGMSGRFSDSGAVATQSDKVGGSGSVSRWAAAAIQTDPVERARASSNSTSGCLCCP